MKKLSTGLLALITLVSVHSSVKAQTADEVIDKYVAALGGKEKLASLKSVKMVGNLSVQGTDVGITITAVNGIGARTDISVPGMGEGFQIMNAKKGWSFMPFQGQTEPTEVSADMVKSSQSQLDIQGVLSNYKEKGSTVELAGKEAVHGADAYKLKLTSKDGKVSTIFIDSKTFYKVKSISKTATQQGEMDMETTYTDFKKTDDGFMFPYSQTNNRGTIMFTSVETNKPVDEKIFTAE